MISIIAIDHYLNDILEPLDRDDILSVIVSCIDSPDVSDMIVEEDTDPKVKSLFNKSKLLLSMRSQDKDPYIRVKVYKEEYIFYQASSNGKGYIILPNRLVRKS